MSEFSKFENVGSNPDETRIAEIAAQFEQSPTLDNLSVAACRMAREGLPAGPHYHTDNRFNALLRAAKDTGLDEKAAVEIIRVGLDQGRKELQAEFDALPEEIAKRELRAEIGSEAASEHIRSCVYRYVKNGKLAPEQVHQSLDGRMPLYGHDDPRRKHNDDMQRAIQEGIAVALADWSKTDTPEMASIRGTPTVGRVRMLMEKVARPESLYVEAAVFERLLNIAILSAEGRVFLPTIEHDRQIETELEAVKRTPTLQQLKESTLKIGRRGNYIALDVFKRLAVAMDSPHLPVAAPTVAPGSVLTVPAAEQGAPEGPVSAITKTIFHDPAEAPDYEPRDLAPMQPEISGNLLESAKESAGHRSRTQAEILSESRQNPNSARIIAVDGKSLAHKSLAARRKG